MHFYTGIVLPKALYLQLYPPTPGGISGHSYSNSGKSNSALRTLVETIEKKIYWWMLCTLEIFLYNIYIYNVYLFTGVLWFLIYLFA